MEIFQKKSNTFGGIFPFSHFYRNDRNFLYHLFGLLVPGFMSRKQKNLPDFVNDTTQSGSCFRCQKEIRVPFDGNALTEISVQMVYNFRTNV